MARDYRKAQVNTTHLIATVAAIPKVTQPKGRDCVELYVVATDKYQDVEHKLWINVTCWGGIAKFAAHLEKGQEVYIQGKLCWQEWEKDGVKRTRIFLTAGNLQAITWPKGHVEAETFDDNDPGDDEELIY